MKPFYKIKKSVLPLLILLGNYLNAQSRDYRISQYQSLYMSSPVTSSTIGGVLPNSGTGLNWGNFTHPSTWTVDNIYYQIARFDELTQSYVYVTTSQNMEPGRGYIVTTGGNGDYDATNEPIYDFPQNYSGTSNDGNDVQVNVAVGSNLLGNPYSDFLDADSFLLDSDNEDMIQGPLYLWTNNTISSNLVVGTNVYNFSPNDYALYNVLGGVSAGRAVTHDAMENLIYNMNIPNGKIYTGTGFFVAGIDSGNVTFKDDMRSATGDVQYFRPGHVSALISPPERHRIWINLERGSYVPDSPANGSPFRQALIGYADGATSGEDDRVFDAESAAAPDIEINVYSLAPVSTPKHLSIQGRWPFNVTDHFQLGYHLTIDADNPAGTYTFTAPVSDGMFDTSTPGYQHFYLKDNVANAVYSFPHEINVTASVTNDTQFEVIFTNCHDNLTAFNSAITTTAVTGATSYEWHITNLETNQVAIYSISGTTTHLTDITNGNISPTPTSTTPFLSYGTSYTYYVVPNSGPESEVCTVTTPKPSVSINCTSVAACSPITLTGGTSNPLHRDYIIKFVGTSGSQTFTIPWSPGSFTPSTLGVTLAYGETYQISVQVDNPGGAALDFSTTCSLSIAVPTTTSIQNTTGNLNPVQLCLPNIKISNGNNCLLRNFNVKITDSASNVTYLYNVSNNPGSFALPALASGSDPFGQSYSIEVQVDNPGGSALSWSTALTVNTPVFPTLTMQGTYCSNYLVPNKFSSVKGNLLDSHDYCSYAKNYRFKLTNVGNSLDTHEYENSSLSQFNLSNFTGLLTSTQYYVQIAPRINNVLGPWSSGTCTITTPSTLKPDNVPDFDVSVNPNPFETEFSIDIKSPDTGFVSFLVYDMLGSLVDSREAKYYDVPNLSLGTKYASGVYNVIVSQGTNKKTVRVIKK